LVCVAELLNNALSLVVTDGDAVLDGAVTSTLVVMIGGNEMVGAAGPDTVAGVVLGG
jgi:hypothetical protein